MTHNFCILEANTFHPGRFTRKCAFTVMAKAPAPGRVKTRLSPPLTPGQAAQLNGAFLRDTIDCLRAACEQVSAACVVSYTPPGEEAAFNGLLPDHTLLLPQRGDSFGERLLTTAEDLFSLGFASVCLIDSDSPTVPTSSYVQAARQLAQDPARDSVVLGRATDGGYYLIGLNQPHAHLFANISWSSASVAEQTEQRAAELGLPVIPLENWFDVDDADSLARLRRELALPPSATHAFPAPWTRHALARISNPGLDYQQTPSAEVHTETSSVDV